MRGIPLLLCARAASGHGTAPPQTILTKSRLLIAFSPKLKANQRNTGCEVSRATGTELATHLAILILLRGFACGATKRNVRT